MILPFRSLRGRGVLWVFLALSLTGWGQMNEVTRDQRLADVAHLDSALGPRMAEFAGREVGLGARNRLVSQMLLEGSVNELDWALALQGWLASAADAHLRLGFERMTTGRTDQPAPSCAELLEGWADFGPGPVVPLSAQCVWLEQTWPWVGALRPNPREVEHEVPSMTTEGMSVVDHGAFLRWVVPSLGQGSDRSFAQDFRRSRRKLRRAAKPVMLDLRGNLGGYRTRRHAVLQAFLATELWPEEREGAWSMAGAFEAVPVMPVVRTKRPMDVSVAVMLDGGSFSASLLLADALMLSGRARVFGCAPLGLRGGCSGSPQSTKLPGSGLWVFIPTLQTELGASGPQPFDLPRHADCDAAGAAWQEAVRWLLAGDLVPLR